VAEVLLAFGYHERADEAPASPHRRVGDAQSVCQCSAPLECTKHPDDRPLVKAPPAWAAAHPRSPVGRTARRLALEPLLRDEVAAELRELTTDQLGQVTRLLLAEHARRAGLLEYVGRRMER
jgi:hypothetical protein